MFSGGIEREHWPEMGLSDIFFSGNIDRKSMCFNQVCVFSLKLTSFLKQNLCYWVTENE